MNTRHLSEADAEAIVDRELWKRMRTDDAYRYAENAEAQAEREDELSREIWADLEAKYEICE